MTPTAGNPVEAAEQTVRAFLAADATARALGITVSRVAPGEVTAHMAVTETMLNGYGSAHGSALFAVADIAFAMACNSHEHQAIGRSCLIEYLAPAFAGDELVATAVERAYEGRTGIYDVAVRRAADGALLAEMRGHSRTITGRPERSRSPHLES
ncbi:MAG: hydroxyphenylacetyl-CoA thioesterase PaaI [Solirubrobacterales bacterium]|nr:hydroxyphenylacetyl-CoA thioesterase PaaI [Solirubrobacterales bacterium]